MSTVGTSDKLTSNNFSDLMVFTKAELSTIAKRVGLLLSPLDIMNPIKKPIIGNNSGESTINQNPGVLIFVR